MTSGKMGFSPVFSIPSIAISSRLRISYQGLPAVAGHAERSALQMST